jgi:hypothetical protein
MRAATRFAPLLLLLLTLLSTGCGLVGGASPTPTPTSTPTATPTRTPTPTPTPRPRVEKESLEVAQGGVAVLEVKAAGESAVASVNGREYPLVGKRGGFWGVIGVDADHELGTYPVSITVRDRAGRVVAELSASLAVFDTPYPVEQIYLEPDQSALLDPALEQQEQATRAAVYSEVTPERLWSGPFIFPVAGAISSPYGIGRSYNGGPVTSFHHGADFSVDEGTPVAAANDGRVAFVGALPIRGTSVIIDHGAGVFSAYHHLSGAAVAEGQRVSKGDLIGYSGASGLATGPHLHWEIIVRGVEVDPVLWTYEEIGP